MFDNILFQDDCVARLTRDVQKNSLPHSLLFSGPELSGKLTMALELARVLSCQIPGQGPGQNPGQNSGQQKAQWMCSCPMCSLHWGLNHQRTLMAGYRNVIPEISAGLDILRQGTGRKARLVCARSIQKLLRRFDPVLWEGEQQKIKKIVPASERLAEHLGLVLSEEPLPEGKNLDSLVNSLRSDCQELNRVLPTVLPVFQIRLMSQWAQYTAGNDHKTLIIDSAERMQDASRNALLKFLEEPPAQTTIIMLTHRKSLLLPTVRSRLREYSLRQRLPSEQSRILERVYNADHGASLDTFFRAYTVTGDHDSAAVAQSFLRALRHGERVLPEPVRSIDDPERLGSFLQALLGQLQKETGAMNAPPAQEAPPAPPALPNQHIARQYEAACIRNASRWHETLNIPIPLVTRHLYSALLHGGS